MLKSDLQLESDLYEIVWMKQQPALTSLRISCCLMRTRASVPACVTPDLTVKPDRQWRSSSFQESKESARITWPLTLTLTLSISWMYADLESILWKFGGDPAICLREEAICAKVYRRTDRRRTPRHCINSFLEWANKERQLFMGNPSQSYRDTGSHSITCHPTQVNAPRLNHSQ